MLTNRLRLIGGKWRGRKLSFPSTPGLRPTGDRLRETLFNWLQTEIVGSHCLDAFAGSGAIGFEALSRGAETVVMLDTHAEVIRQLKDNAAHLQTQAATILQLEASEYLKKNTISFDLIFLDPPFAANLLPSTLALLRSSQSIQPTSLVYVECSRDAALDLSAWQIRKEKSSGQVKMYLLQVK